MNLTVPMRGPMRALIRKKLRSVMFAALTALLAAHTALAAGWTLKDTRGVSHSLAKEKGKWVLVNFWAPWCPPCLAEMPGFSKLQKKHHNLQVIGVAIMYRKTGDVLAVVKKQKLSYPIVLGNEDIASNFGELPGLPTSFLYDPSGKPVGRHQGPLTPREIEHVMAHPSDAKKLFVSDN